MKIFMDTVSPWKKPIEWIENYKELLWKMLNVKKRIIISLTFLDGILFRTKSLNQTTDIQKILSIYGVLMN